jgi:hypothetical protein
MKKHKPYELMTTKELARATRQFDEPFVMDKGRPMNAAERRQHLRAAKRGRGRPVIGKGSRRINLSVERDLLRAADRLARSTEKKRSQIFADGLRLLLRRKAS